MEKVEIECRCRDCGNYESEYNGDKKFDFGYCYYWNYEQGMSPNRVDGNDFCNNAYKKDKK